MTPQDKFVIDNGPSKFDLMLSLFDTDMGQRRVKFHTPEWIHTHDAFEFEVHITSARRRNPAANIWEIEGIVEEPLDHQEGKVRISIYYLSDTREGEARFEKELRTHGIMETPIYVEKTKALMRVVNNIVDHCRVSGTADVKVLEQLGKAQRVWDAETAEDLQPLLESLFRTGG